jgi:microsomal dipeptidase-like Zn-dependent dipeptidase
MKKHSLLLLSLFLVQHLVWSQIKKPVQEGRVVSQIPDSLRRAERPVEARPIEANPTQVTPVLIPVLIPVTVAPPPLYGFVDMHTHPVAQLGFGEQLFFGGNDGNPSVALSSCNCVHNFVAPPFSGNCGQQNMYRNKMVDQVDMDYIRQVHNKTAGYPDFVDWPKYNSLLHQQMWWEWIKRARDGGLRVMVALAVNSHTMADAAETGGVNDDLNSMNKQINEMKALFGRHTDFAEIAYTSADLRRIVTAGKLAVILGIEMDNIGNFYSPADPKGASYNPNPSDQQIKAEIDRLFNMGVRYIFPIHITNNAFGGTALYNKTFNIANKYNTGSAFVPEVVSTPYTKIAYRLESPFTPIRQDALAGIAMAVKGAVLPAQIMPDNPNNYPSYLPGPAANYGNRNSVGITAKGQVAVRYMMQKGMIIDIDHMSEKAAEFVLGIAQQYNYPVNSGHNGFREIPGGSSVSNENGRTNDQVKQIYELGGMMGIGHGQYSYVFVNNYRYGLGLTGNKSFAIGTDVNGMFPLPTPPVYGNPGGMVQYGVNGLTQCRTGNKTWDFNLEGMAHYGLLWDYIESCKKTGMSQAEQNAFFSGAERFVQMWEKCNTSKTNVP